MNIKDALDSVRRTNRNIKSANTALTYDKGIKVFEEYLNETGVPVSGDISELDADVFVGFPLWLCEKYEMKSTISIYLAGIRSCINYFIISGDFRPTTQDTARIALAFRQPGQRRHKSFPRFPKSGVAEAVKDAVYQMGYPPPIKERNIALVEFLYSSGCRNNEVAQLRVCDIDIEERRAIVTGKGDKERLVYFSSRAAETIKVYWGLCGELPGNDPVFARHDRGAGAGRQAVTPTTVRNIISELTEIARLPKGSFTPHYFRHAFAIKVLRETKNLSLVQDLLGHESPVSTRVYAKIYPEDIAVAYNAIYG